MANSRLSYHAKRAHSHSTACLSSRIHITHQYHHRNDQCSTLSLLHRYFIRPTGTFIDDAGSVRLFDNVTYTEYFTFFRLSNTATTHTANMFAERETVIDSPSMHVIRRDHSRCHLTRIQPVHPSQGNLFYLRTILQNRPALSFEDAHTVNGSIKNTYQEAAMAMGLFADCNEAQMAMEEAIQNLKTPRQLQLLFVHLLVNDCVPSPISLWDMFHYSMSTDFHLQSGNNIKVAYIRTLENINMLLEEFGRSPADYGLPLPPSHTSEVLHEIIQWGFQSQQLDKQASLARNCMTPEQATIFDCIVNAITLNETLLAFVDGKAGRGKTYLINAICNKVRSLGRIVLATATAAFAAHLYPGGHTTHSTFKVIIYFHRLTFTNSKAGTSQQQK